MIDSHAEAFLQRRFYRQGDYIIASWSARVAVTGFLDARGRRGAGGQTAEGETTRRLSHSRKSCSEHTRRNKKSNKDRSKREKCPFGTQHHHRYLCARLAGGDKHSASRDVASVMDSLLLIVGCEIQYFRSYIQRIHIFMLHIFSVSVYQY